MSSALALEQGFSRGQNVRWPAFAETLQILTPNKHGHAEPQTDLTSPPSIRSVDPVIQRAPGDIKNAISSAISFGSP
jgi:hypothetical protein